MVKCSISLICKSTSNLKRRKIDETPEQYLKQITHLYLNGKRLEKIGSELALCRNLSVLYLYDNRIKEIPDLSVLPHLTHLYLQNNNIIRIHNLSQLAKLEKLFLSRNCISVVEGLEGLLSLRELRIDNQRLTAGQNLVFDDQSINSMANTLTKLDVSGNGLDTLEDLKPLGRLTYLCASNNRLQNIASLTGTLASWPELKQLELHGNPVLCKQRVKDAIIVSTKSLESLDDRPISQSTKQFLENWSRHRNIRLDSSETALRRDLLIPETSLQFRNTSESVLSTSDSICLTNHLEHDIKAPRVEDFKVIQGASVKRGSDNSPDKFEANDWTSITDGVIPSERGESGHPRANPHEVEVLCSLAVISGTETGSK